MPKKQEKTSRLKQEPDRKLPEGVEWDFDGENWQDPYQVSHYAMDIFNYLKEREEAFPIGDYMEKQVCLSRWMRSLLVDWMVEVQESFELNHETLYLAVKLVDLYLTKVTVGKEALQLLGTASLFIASKFDVSKRHYVSINDGVVCIELLNHLFKCISEFNLAFLFRREYLQWWKIFCIYVTVLTKRENFLGWK